MKRRDFIHQLSHSVALPTLMSGISLDHLMQSSQSFLSSTAGEGNILIMVLLNGGNDGLNTVIPLNMMSQLNTIRPKVVMPENKLLPLGKNDLALHPSLPGLLSLSKENRLKIIQSVGYAVPNYSHFRSMDIWQSGSQSTEYLSSGWLGRYLEEKHPTFPEAYPTEKYPDPLAVEIGWNSSLMFTGEHSFTSIVASNPENFYEIIGDLDLNYPSSPVGEKLKYLQIIAKQSNAYGKVLKTAFQKGKEFNFPNTNLGNQFKIISRLISGGLNTRIYKVEIGGFDTHSSQVDTSDKTKGAHANLMKELDDSISFFMKTMDQINQSDRIVGMCFSEFGRTTHSNDTYGTDHGAVAPVILFGNRLDTSVLGTNPIIPTKISQEELTLQYDFKQVYSSLITQWLGGASSLSSIFTKDYNQVSIIAEAYRDSDEDGVGDLYDQCPNTPAGAIVDITGCEIFTMPSNNYSVSVSELSCKGTKNGSIRITVKNTSYLYQVSISDRAGASKKLQIEKGKTELQISDLAADTYKISITIDGKANYQQNFECKINEPDVLKVNASISEEMKLLTLYVSGTDQYQVSINGIENTYVADKINIPIETGLIELKVSTKYGCQEAYEKTLFLSENVQCFPNPVVDRTTVYLNGEDAEVGYKLINFSGQEVIGNRVQVDSSRTLSLDMSNYPSGVYMLQLQSAHISKTLKLVKL